MGKFSKHGNHHAWMRPNAVRVTAQRCEKLVWRTFWGRCEAAGNARRFPTRGDARIAQRHQPGHPHLYRCEACGDYHVVNFPIGVQNAIDLLLRSLSEDVTHGRLDRDALAALAAAT